MASKLEIGFVALAVDMRDDVAGLDAQAPGGGAFDGRDDHQAVFLLLDLDPQPVVFADVVLSHPREILRLEEIRMRVERLQEAVDGGIGQLFRIQVLVIAVLEDGDDGIDLVQGDGPEVLVRGGQPDESQQEDSRERFSFSCQRSRKSGSILSKPSLRMKYRIILENSR